MSEASHPIRIKPEQAIAEAAALGQKIANGAKLFEEIRDEDVEIATTPKDEVWRQDKVTLYRYRPVTEQKVKTPVLIAYGLIGRYTMADLQEDRSLVRNLLNLGVDLYVVDWGNPSRADRWLTLDDYIDGYLGECVEFIRERHGIDKVNLLGICEGGVFTTCYAALHPETVKNLVLTITPVDFHGDANEERLGLRVHQSLDPQPQARGHRPPDRGPRQPAGRADGLGVLDDDAHAHADEVQPRPARGHGRQEEASELPAHGEVDRGPPAPSGRGRQAVAQGPLPGQQARERRAGAGRAHGRPEEHHHAGAERVRQGRPHHPARDHPGAQALRREQGLPGASAAWRPCGRVRGRQVAGAVGPRASRTGWPSTTKTRPPKHVRR